jgi:hypothetical protein
VTLEPKAPRPLLIGGLCLAGALLFALGSLFAPTREKTNRSFSQGEKTTSLISQVVSYDL